MVILNLVTSALTKWGSALVLNMTTCFQQRAAVSYAKTRKQSSTVAQKEMQLFFLLVLSV